MPSLLTPSLFEDVEVFMKQMEGWIVDVYGSFSVADFGVGVV